MIDKRGMLIGMVAHWLKKVDWKRWLVITLFGVLPMLALLSVAHIANAAEYPNMSVMAPTCEKTESTLSKGNHTLVDCTVVGRDGTMTLIMNATMSDGKDRRMAMRIEQNTSGAWFTGLPVYGDGHHLIEQDEVIYNYYEQ